MPPQLHPRASARAAALAEYGDGFADFLAGFAPAQSLPYLADVARLEWAINAAYHAPIASRCSRRRSPRFQRTPIPG